MVLLSSSISGPRATPDFSRIGVRITSPSGTYPPGTLQEPSSEVSKLITTALKHATPSRSIFDIVGLLHDDLIAQYPKALRVSSTYSSDNKLLSSVKGFSAATCAVRTHIENPRITDAHKDTAYDADYFLKSAWQFPIGGDSLNEVISIIVITHEHLTPSIYDLRLTPLTSSRETNVGQIHPTFDIHQSVSQSTLQIFKEGEDIAPLRLASLLFKLADEQSPCKRLIRARVDMKLRAEKKSNSYGNNVYVVNHASLNRDQYEQSQHSTLSQSPPDDLHRVYIALGSNIGDRIGNIESACRQMQSRGLNVVRTSALYETRAMYLEDQQSFINGACEVVTSLGPTDLLDQLKAIEKDLGREKTIDNGPRTIDLDILLYENKVLESRRLSIPHKRMLEREFVLRPLCDLIPNGTMPTMYSVTNFQTWLDSIPPSSEPLTPLTPLSPQQAPLSSQHSSRSTHVMAILNLTPDSFSDGGLHPTTEPTSLIPTIKSYLIPPKPISILDIGGQSTRPHAPQIPAKEELSRILPTIKQIRSDPSFDKLAISVDTYRASVAAAAIAAGANMINDVSAGQADPEMLPAIAKLGCTCTLMHMRGTPETMTKLTDYPSGIINGVGKELLTRVREAEAAGIRRWRIILDPGIGFAKTQAQNLELLRRFSELRNFEGLRGFPWVVGASRKGFIGKITGVEEASERKWGTAAAVTAAIQGGADVVRVHDVGEMGRVVKMADAIWRT